MAEIVETEPLVRREKNLAMVILALDGPVEASWREIFDGTVKATDPPFPFDVGLTHDLRAVQGGTAAVASLNLGDLQTAEVDEKVKSALTTLTDLVHQVNDEDTRRTKNVEQIEASAAAWYKKAKK